MATLELGILASGSGSNLQVAGCTVVDEGVDSRPIVVQRAVPVLDGDTVEALSTRILHEEHLAYVEVLRWLAADRIHWLEGQDGERSKIAILPA